MKARLTAERAREVLAYDPLSGVLTWKVSTNGRIKPGDQAGWLTHDGYIRVRIDGRIYAAHRVAWLIEKGDWPAKELDHEDGIRNRNVWSNLREATEAQNSANRKTPSTNTSGRKGVRRRGNSYSARIKVEGRVVNLGSFTSLDLASQAYDAAARELFGAFARSSR